MSQPRRREETYRGFNGDWEDFWAALATMRQKHLQAVADLLQAINNGNLLMYLGDQFKCP